MHSLWLIRICTSLFVFILCHLMHTRHAQLHHHLVVTVYFVSLLGQARNNVLNPEQQVFARPEDDGIPVIDVIHKYKPVVTTANEADIQRHWDARSNSRTIYPAM
jgi:hypothetical protein